MLARSLAAKAKIAANLPKGSLSMNPLKLLFANGQSCWMDDLSRNMIVSGELARRVAEEELHGITSNPTIFEKAISGGKEYNGDIARLAGAGLSP
ncbi:MAG: hypothetical protein J2P49_00745, partial [Methylocapsa sp.]|nr:hypothetical protein [Methylocapsa sp.]